MDSLLLIGIGLLALGLLLLVLEAFVPSGGILGISAAISAIVGIVFLFRHDPMWGATGLLLTAVLGPMAFFSALKMLPNTAIGRTMVGPSAEEIAEERMARTRAMRAEREKLKDQEGEALTAMRPSGVVMINGERHDAIARGGLVEKGERVRVIKVDGLTIEVRGLG
ncbi:MAG: NfeD family protein [Phycisphaerales bacterium JB052]